MEGMIKTFFKEEEAKQIWDEIPKAKDKDGKVTETVERLALERYFLNRSWKKQITESRLATYRKSIPDPPERCENVLLDFL